MQHDSHRLAINNFDLLRLFLALTVCLVHSYDLSGFAALSPITMLLSSVVAVKAFFVVSGFLIFMSFERSSSLRSYFNKRIRRIYPAYFTVVVLCAVGLFIFSSKSFSDYFSLAWLKYLAANLFFLNFLQPDLPGVFEHNRMNIINGALWTLKVEVMFYLCVPCITFLMRRFNRALVIGLIYVASVIYDRILSGLAASSGRDLFNDLSYQLPGQLSYFMAGAFFYYYLPLVERHGKTLLLVAIIVLAINQFYFLPFFEPFALATMVIGFALFTSVINVGKYGDFSYGIYILHFPVIQLLLQEGGFQEKPWQFFGAIFVIVLTAAVLMWHLVEKRFLFRASHYVQATEVQ